MPWTEVLLSFGGILFGFVLAAFWEYVKDARRDRAEASNIRRILAEEVRYNKTTLKDIHDLVMTVYRQREATEKQSDAGAVVAEGNPLRMMSRFSPSRLTSEAWLSQLPKIPSVLDSRQIVELLVFHRSLAEIQSLQTSFIDKPSSSTSRNLESMMRILRLIEEVVSQSISIED